MSENRYGAVEAGGTKIVCLVGSGPGRVTARTRIPTGDPEPTLRRVVEFFAADVREHGPLTALGVASFGPVELRRDRPDYGFILTSPKAGWKNVDVVGTLAAEFDVPIGFHTDVAGAALAEGRWGASRGLGVSVYMTVGTGIGAAAVTGGRPAAGLVHAEMGHIGVPRQPGDDFAGDCPFHGDCLEGMAGGAALAARWGRPAEQLTGTDLAQALEWEAAYLAAGLRTIVYTVAPERFVLGGSVAGGLPGLLPLVRARLTETLSGYPGLPEQARDEFVSAAQLGGMAGPAGGFVLAELALAELGAALRGKPA
ncbi:ROK family protein [Kineosporia succinea]|uniref:fructokinase n=1 Tax=Kineosporia succinea TaxID=84632 RepID=A0ABT9NWM0_9ACTN|nr:ROK family protein [Kineosporia succinea]MDP9824400.1 fructokinase [Kineosporia succinea]